MKNETKNIPSKRLALIRELLYYIFCSRLKTYYGSLENYLEERAFMRKWYKSERHSHDKDTLEKIATSRNRFNSCFGIPHGLIKELLGYWKDSEGKNHRYSVRQMERQLGGLLDKTLHRGNNFNLVDGKYSVSGSFRKKYILSDSVLHALWDERNEERFGRYFKFEALDRRISSLVVKYYKKHDKENTQTQKQEEEKMNRVPFEKMRPVEEKPTVGAPDDGFEEANEPKEKPIQVAITPKTSSFVSNLQNLVYDGVVSESVAAKIAKLLTGRDEKYQSPRFGYSRQDADQEMRDRRFREVYCPLYVALKDITVTDINRELIGKVKSNVIASFAWDGNAEKYAADYRKRKCL